jgi:hypothetical protein
MVEAIFASALMLLVMGAFGTMTTLLIGSATRAVSGENASTDMRSVVTQLQSDLQAAAPNTNAPINSPTGLIPPPSLAAAPLQLQMQIGPVGAQQTVTWTYNAATGSLTRALSSSPTAAPTTTINELNSVANACTTTSCPQPVFTYFGQAGNNVLVFGSPAPSTVSNCTARVEVDLFESGGKKALVPEQKLDVQLANVLPGSLSCG